MHQADGRVGHAEGKQLPVRADLLTAPGERAGGEHVIAEGDDEHAEGGQRQLAESGRPQGGECRDGQASRDRPGHLHAVPLQPEPGDRRGREQDREQRPWRMRPPGAHREQERQDGHGDQRRGEPGITEVTGERRHLRKELLAGDRHARWPRRVARRS